jgi:hypothetical protein
VGSHEWDDFPGTLCARLYLGGGAIVDQIDFPTKGWKGMTVRTYEVEKHDWAIYWISSRTGLLQPPVYGGFTGDHGEFYGDDDDDGRPIRALFNWTKIDHEHARWEQSFSYDGGATWETNWTADFVRADEAALCTRGVPKSSAPPPA